MSSSMGELLAKGDSYCLVKKEGGHLIGYALCSDSLEGAKMGGSFRISSYLHVHVKKTSYLHVTLYWSCFFLCL